jgi:hypothetical protein
MCRKPPTDCFHTIFSTILTVVDVAIVTISTLERGAAAESTACQDAATPSAPEILSP